MLMLLSIFKHRLASEELLYKGICDICPKENEIQFGESSVINVDK